LRPRLNNHSTVFDNGTVSGLLRIGLLWSLSRGLSGILSRGQIFAVLKVMSGLLLVLIEERSAAA